VGVNRTQVFRRVHIGRVPAGEFEPCGGVQLGRTLQPLTLVSPLFQLQKVGVDLGLLDGRFESEGAVEAARVRSAEGSLVGVFVDVGSPWGLLCLLVLEESSRGLGRIARLLLQKGDVVWTVVSAARGVVWAITHCRDGSLRH
jgi:hypothetical protein